MNRSLVIASALVSSLVAAIAGCHTDTEGTSASSACSALYDAYTGYYNKCQPTQQFGDKAGFLKVCELNLAAPGASGASGPLNECANAINGLAPSCGDTDSDVCKTSGGSLATGTACGNDIQCASKYCKGGGISESSSSGTTVIKATCGVCADPIAVGQPCTGGDRCAESSVCQGTASNNGTCIAIAKNDIGGTCSSVPMNGTINDCKAGLRCTADHKCVALSASGGDCESSSDCAYPLTCTNKICGAAKAVGAACEPDVPGPGCDRGLVCDFTSKTCLAITEVEPGGACDDELRFCKHGGCRVPSVGADGGKPTGTCPALLAEGDACDPSSGDKACGDFLYCLDGKCGIFDPSTCK